MELIGTRPIYRGRPDKAAGKIDAPRLQMQKKDRRDQMGVRDSK